MASSESRRKSHRSVSFAETATVFYFDRQPSFDRWPKDGKTFGLGMQETHFFMDVQPVSEGTGHVSVPRLQYAQRKELLHLGAVTAAQRHRLEIESKELKGLYISNEPSGCSCVGDCYPQSCECMIAGVACCQSRSHALVPRCRCSRPWCPTTREMETYREKGRRLVRYSRERLASLSNED